MISQREGAAAAIDTVEIVAGLIAFARRHCRCRRHADHGDGPLRPGQIDARMLVVVAVNHELGAMARECRAKIGAVEEPLEASPGSAQRRMVNQHDAK